MAGRAARSAPTADGVVYVVFEGFDKQRQTDVFYQTRSFDGGRTFERPRAIVDVAGIGQFDPAQGRFTIDGVAGARTNTFPSIDIANGAPTGADATDEIVVTWSDDRAGHQQREGLPDPARPTAATATRRPPTVSTAGDRANQPAVAISPDGADVYVVYNAYLDAVAEHHRESAADAGGRQPRRADRRRSTSLHRGAVGDARGSSANGLTSEFLGDYNYAVATRDSGAAVWNDVRDAADCPAIDAYRQAFVDDVSRVRPSPWSGTRRRTSSRPASCPTRHSDALRPGPNNQCPQGADALVRQHRHLRRHLHPVARGDRSCSRDRAHGAVLGTRRLARARASPTRPTTTHTRLSAADGHAL